MTIETWFAFAATAVALVILPNPLTRTVALYSKQRGRLSAVVTVPALALGLGLAFTAGLAPLLLVCLYAPSAMTAIGWVGIAYAMVYVLWCFQDPQVRAPLADNDNLPTRRFDRIFADVFVRCVRTPRYAIILAALTAQFLRPSLSLSLQAEVLTAIFLASIAGSALAQALIPSLALRGTKRFSRRNPALNKPGTVFIARRAVTAGFRRIAA